MEYVAIIGGYILTSLLLFKYPNLIHKKKQLKFKCKHISHRGGAGENYENTMVAFRRALELGTEMFELDCHLTKDGEVVVSHDHNLLRSTGKDCDISQLAYEELPLLRPELPLDFDPGIDHIFVGSGHPDERRLTRLKDVFEEFPNIPINIDIKVNDDLLIQKVSKLIQQYKREEITVWGNFNDVVTRKCYAENPHVNLLFSMRRVIWLVLLTYTGLLPFVPLRESHLEIFLPSIYLRRRNVPNASYLPLHTTLVKVMEVLLMRKSLFEHLQKRGIQNLSRKKDTMRKQRLCLEMPNFSTQHKVKKEDHFLSATLHLVSLVD